jgi:hypothetical protein
MSAVRSLPGEQRTSRGPANLVENDPNERSQIPFLDDHKCYSFAPKVGRRRRQGVRCEAEKQGGT